MIHQVRGPLLHHPVDKAEVFQTCRVILHDPLQQPFKKSLILNPHCVVSCKVDLGQEEFAVVLFHRRLEVGPGPCRVSTEQRRAR